MIDAEYEASFPWIRWRDPVQIVPAGTRMELLGCRFCIALLGLKGAELMDTEYVFRTREEFDEHMRAKHE